MRALTALLAITFSTISVAATQPNFETLSVYEVVGPAYFVAVKKDNVELYARSADSNPKLRYTFKTEDCNFSEGFNIRIACRDKKVC